jgi:hypothetical protein
MLPSSYVLPSVQAINVFSYGAKGDGTTPDATAIQNAAAALTTGQGLFFPATGSSYNVGPTTIDLPAGCPVYGVAGQAALAPSRRTLVAQSGLAVCGDGNGNLSATQGHVFDAGGGRLVYQQPGGTPGSPISVYAGPALPGRGANEYLVLMERLLTTQWGISTGWSDDGLTTIEVSDFIASTTVTTENFFDPTAVILPNGHILVAATHVGPATSNPGSIQIYLSTDGGRQWTLQNEISPPSPHKFSDAYMIRLRMPNTGAENRVVLCFMDFFTDGSSDTMYRIAYSDTEFATYTLQTNPATPATGLSSSAGRVSDEGRACIYEIADGPVGVPASPGNIGIIYTRRTSGVPAQIWGLQLNNVGQIIDPTKATMLATVPEQAGTGQAPYNVQVLVGCAPIVQRLSTGEYGLYITASTFDLQQPSDPNHTTGVLRFMSCPPSAQGDPTKFVQNRLVSVTTTNGGGGYGRVQPLPKPSGDIELLMIGSPQTGTQIYTASVFSVTHYGAA